MADEWRRIAATLADPVRRQVYASVLLDVPIDISPKKRDKALAALVAAGLVIARGDRLVAVDDAFSASRRGTRAHANGRGSIRSGWADRSVPGAGE